jgi:hypothetical protein
MEKPSNPHRLEGANVRVSRAIQARSNVMATSPAPGVTRKKLIASMISRIWMLETTSQRADLLHQYLIF